MYRQPGRTTPACRSGPSVGVLHEREDVVAGELLATLQELQLDHEREADHRAAELLDQVDLGPGGAPRGQEVVVDKHARSALDRVGVQLERIEAVLERVLGADRAPGKLAWLAGRHEAAAEPVGERRAQDEPARLGAEDQVWLARLGELGELLDGLAQRLRIRQQRHDVLEDDAALREVRDVPNAGGEVAHDRGTIPRSARRNRRFESSCESAASVSRFSSPAWRFSGFGERSSGATMRSSRSASLSAQRRNVARFLGATP